MADIDISIATSGNAAGAEKVAKAIEDVRGELAAVKAAMAAMRAESKQGTAALDAMEKELDQLDDKAVQAAAAVRQVGTAQTGAAGSSRNMGGAVLEASRAIEDMQYGIRGVLNNIPGLIAMLGGGAGLAGAVSLLAVGLTVIGPKLHEWVTNSEDAAKAVADALAESVRAAEDAKEKRIAAIDAEIEAYDRQIAKTRELRRAEMERVDARAALDLAKVDAAEARGELSPEDAIRARTGIADAQARAKAAAEQKTVEEEVSKATRDATAARAKAREEQAAADAAAAMLAQAQAQRQAESDLPGMRSKVGSFKAAGAQASPEGRAELARMQAEIAAKEALVGAGVPDVESVKKLEENKAAADAAARAAAERSREAAANEGRARDVAAARLPAIRDTLAIDEQRRQVEMQSALSRKSGQQASAQTQIDFSGQGLANQVGGLMGQLSNAGVGGNELAAVRAAIEKLSNEGVQSGEGAGLAGALNRLAEMLPAKLSGYEKRIADAELAAKRLEDRLNNLRSEPGN